MADSYALQFDDQGRPYYQWPGMPKTYVSPVAMGGEKPKDTTGIFRTAPSFNQNTGDWETGLDWGNILSLVAAGVITGGAADALLSGGGAAASATGGAAGAGGGGGAAGVTTAATGSGIGTQLLRYALPVGAGIVGDIIQTKANTKASETEQKYLEEALAYQKEQDAYNRARQEKLDAQEQERYGTTQQQLQEKIAREGGRYSDYTNNIAPYLATGASANSKMASLLGLPAPPPFTPNASGQRYGAAATDPSLDPAVQAFVTDWQKTHPVSEGVGPLYDALTAAGFSVARPTHAGNLPSDDKLAIDGQMYDFATNWNPTGAGSSWTLNYVEPYATPKVTKPTTTATTTPTATADPVETRPGPVVDPTVTTDAVSAQRGPTNADALVTVQAPTGETRKVPKAEADHYVQLGARIIG